MKHDAASMIMKQVEYNNRSTWPFLVQVTSLEFCDGETSLTPKVPNKGKGTRDRLPKKEIQIRPQHSDTTGTGVRGHGKADNSNA